MRGDLSRQSRRTVRRDRGTTLPGCLFSLIIFLLLGYLGFKFGEAGWTYLEMRYKTREALNWVVSGQPKSEADIYSRFIVNGRDAGVELTHRNIKLMHAGDNLLVTIVWRQEVFLPYYTVPLNCKINMSEVKRWYRGNLVVK